MRKVYVAFSILTLATVLSSCTGKQKFAVAPASESFSQVVEYNSKVDLLWVIDNSRSMSQHQAHLSEQFGAFIDTLNQRRIDYHIAITTMDMSVGGARGHFIGSPTVITSHMTNAKQLFQETVLIGEDGSDVERGLEAAKVALSENLLLNENSGFFRSDAQLAIIFVTNEEDHSSDTVTSYADYFDALKPPTGIYDDQLWTANFIGITEPDGLCFTQGGVADPGDRYMELANITGGQIAEICQDDLSEALSNIRKRIVSKLTFYKLAKEPVLDSIYVYVNNVSIHEDPVNGWTYEPETRILRLHGTSIPDDAEHVRIDYQPIAAHQ